MSGKDDTDDLYADLYGGGGGAEDDVVDLGAGHGDDGEGKMEEGVGGGDEQDLIGYEDESDAQKQDATSAAAKEEKPTSGSFIPPASTGTQIKGSFIPPAQSNDHGRGGSDARDLTALAHGNNQGNHDQSGQDQHHEQQQYQQQQQQQQQNNHSQGEGDENRPVMPHEMPEEGKMFVGGLNWDTTEETLRRYFSQFGEVGHCTIMRDNMTGRSRGFAFLNFVDPKAVNTVMVREHYLDGKVIDPKRAIPRPQGESSGIGGGRGGGGGGGGGYGGGSRASQHGHDGPRNQKLFVGGLPATVTPDSFRRFFEQYGALAECTCMMDRETGKPRGYGFITFQDDSSVDRILSSHPIVFDGKEVDVKRAQSKNDPASLAVRRSQRSDNPEFGMGGQQNNRYGNQMGGAGNNNSNFNAAAAGGWGMMNPMMMGMMGGGAQGGFDPNAMAQMYQNMGWGSANWNPQMAWQQMMANMGGGAGGAPGQGGMDMSAMMGGGMGMPNMGMMGMGGMGGMTGMGGMGGMGGSMSPPMGMTMGSGGGSGSQRGGSAGPGNEDRSDRAGSNGPRGTGANAAASRYQRGTSGSGSMTSKSGLPSRPGDDYREGSRDHQRERSPGSGRGNGDDRSYRRERSPSRRDENKRYDSGSRSRY